MSRVGRPPAPEHSTTLYVRVSVRLYQRLERIAQSRPGLTISAVARHFLTRGLNITGEDRLVERGPGTFSAVQKGERHG